MEGRKGFLVPPVDTLLFTYKGDVKMRASQSGKIILREGKALSPERGGEHMKKTISLQEAQIALATTQKKTNADWYAFEMLGSYFKFEQGVLCFFFQAEDGIRDDSPCEVDWER